MKLVSPDVTGFRRSNATEIVLSRKESVWISGKVFREYLKVLAKRVTTPDGNICLKKLDDFSDMLREKYPF